MVHFLRFFQLSRRWLKFSFLAISILMLCLIATPLVAQSVSPKNLVQQGKQFYEIGQFEQALSHWEQATAAYQKQQDTVGTSGSLINQAQALSALGLQRRACKTLVQALKSSDADSDRLCDPIFDDKQVFQPDLSDPLLASVQATGLRSLGNVLRLIGNLEASQAILEQSWKIAPQDAKADVLVSLGNTLRDLGNRDRDRTDKIGNIQGAAFATNCLANRTGSKTAIAYYEQAIDCYQEAANNASNSFTTIQAQSNHLALLVNLDQWLYQNNPVEAIQWKAQTRSQITSLITNLSPLIERLPATYEGIFTRINFARSLGMQFKQNKLAGNNPAWQVASSTPTFIPPADNCNTAKQLFEQAWQQAQALKNIRASSSAAGNLGWLYEQSEQWDEALLWTEIALKRAKQLTSADLMYQWEWQTGRILKQQGKVKDAIAHYTLAIQALDSVRHNLMPANADVQFSFRDQVEPVYRELVDLLLSDPTPDRLKQSVEYIDALQLAELEDFLRCLVSPQVALDSELDSHTALLHSIILPDRVVAILQRSGQPLNYHSTLIKQEQAEGVLENLRAYILRQNSPEEVLRDASQVYEWLIAPFESELEQNSDIRTLVFTLDGALRNIPIAALYDAKRKEYLVQKKYATAVTPGLRIFELKPLQRDKLRILAAGISEARTVENRPFNALANVNQELESIRTLFPAKVKQLLNAEFTETGLREKIDTGAFTIAHLATHGAFSADPEATYILTFDRLIKSYAWNDLLKVNTQTTLKPFDLLVMSACQTAKGDRRATLGLAGIAVRTGARSTVSSLWKVADKSTAKLMESFYTELSKPDVSRAEALHRAQQSIFGEPNSKTPYYWAAFVLVGNWL
ncbi:CHAT domain-containing protein [Leptolyngbyaceae cyanobacterium UHCC 1019]